MEQSNRSLEPVIVVTPDGALYLGTVGNDALSVDAAVVGLVGLAGNDTLMAAPALISSTATTGSS